MEELNDKAADSYDRVWEAYHGILGKNFMRDTQKRINWVCGMVEGKKVFDIGCSSGVTAILLAREGCEVVGIDSDSRVIEEANKHLADEPLFIQQRVRFIEADFLTFDGFENEKFDTVIASEILEHLVRPVELLKKATNFLNNEGRIIITVPFGINDFIDHKRTYYLTEPYSLVAKYFNVVNVEILGKWIGIVGSLKDDLLMPQISSWDNNHILAFENAVFQIERKLHDDLVLIKNKVAELANKNKELVIQSGKLKSELTAFKNETDKINTKLNSMLKSEEKFKLQISREEKEKYKIEEDLKLLREQHQIKLLEIERKEKENLKLKSEIRIIIEKSQNDANTLKEELNIASQNAKQKENELISQVRALEDQIKKLDSNLKGMVEREKRYKSEIAKASNRTLKIKDTISFQLGFALVNCTKSLSSFFYLPKEIFLIRQEAKRRKNKKNDTKNLIGGDSIIETEKKESQKHEDKKIFKKFLSLSFKKIFLNDDKVKEFKFSCKRLKDLRVAAVMDEFSYKCFEPECNLLQLNPEKCIEQLEEFRPDFLFIESAWKGDSNRWERKISNSSVEIVKCISFCKKSGIPTLFWNKEDPVHFPTFLEVANQCDYIFTTDIDCIPKYKNCVCHDRVYFFPFAAQPAFHNPIEKYDRKNAFNFAGSYYHRYPERQRDFDLILKTLLNFLPVEIYDRNFNNSHPNYKFPDAYQSMIIGCLPVEEIEKAYKGYRYGININTIKNSQSMFARRVFELMASNTLIVSNFSRALRMMFGDLVISTDSQVEIEWRISEILNNEVLYRKNRLMSLRKVLQEHTYSHRLSYIQAKLLGKNYESESELSDVLVIAIAKSYEEQEKIIENFLRQNYPKCYMYLLTNFNSSNTNNLKNIRIFKNISEIKDALNKDKNKNYLIGVFTAEDYYGPSYLTDLALTVSYSDAQAFGKFTHYSSEGGVSRLLNDGHQYRYVNRLNARSSLFRSIYLENILTEQFLQSPETACLELKNMIAIDEFNYCFFGESLKEVLKKDVDDLNKIDKGLSFSKDLSNIDQQLGSVCVSTETDIDLIKLDADNLYRYLNDQKSKNFALSITKNTLSIQSFLYPGKHAYIYLNKNFSREELNLVLNSQFRFDGEHNFEDCRTVFEFLDENEQKVSHAMNGSVGSQHALAIHPNCKAIRFGLRIQGPGTIKVNGLILGGTGERASFIVGKSPYLVLTKQYPAYEDLYRYGFLHSRVSAYKKLGTRVDVYRIENRAVQTYREFENIDIATGDLQLLDETLKSGRYKIVLIHLFDEKMWKIIEPHIEKIRIIVWVHGAEIQNWKHRTFDFINMNEDEIERQKKLSYYRDIFWKKIFAISHKNMHFIFVSNYLKNQVEEDLQVVLKNESYTIINNYINDEIFQYKEKSPEDRLKILSIRPYFKRLYANDLTTAAIIELSKRDYFENLNFTIIGDGDLFDKTVEELKNFKNVKLIKRFLSQREVAKQHELHGVFLCPTRMDTQGVSRDEAMCSGLVPITTNVAAIPEFVDETCAMIVPPEDYMAIADKVEYLYNNANVFNDLSKNAANRVRMRSCLKNTILKEIELINKK